MTTSLKTLIRRRDADGIASVITNKVANGSYQPRDNELLGKALALLEPDRTNELLAQVLEANSPRYPVSCADLLATVAADDDEAAPNLQDAASAMLAVIPQDSKLLRAKPAKQPQEWPDANMVIDLLDGLERIDPALALQALEQLTAAPALYPLDTVLKPAALCLYTAEDMRGLASIEALRDNVMVHLQQRVAEPLIPPADWSRANPFSDSTDEHLQDLGKFLENPDESAWSLRATKKIRQQVEQQIEYHGCDLDCETDTSRQPHTLICTKNEKTFQRLAEIRQQDWVDLATLESVVD